MTNIELLLKIKKIKVNNEIKYNSVTLTIAKEEDKDDKYLSKKENK